MPSVLFVCTANIIRSPMAVALFRQQLGDASVDWRVESAGTWARQGDAASSTVKSLMAERGLDLSDHRSRVVTLDLLRQFNLILTMERGHKEAIKVEFPSISQRVYLMSEMVDMSYDVADPIGGSSSRYKETLDEIDAILKIGFDRILSLA